LKEYFLHYVGQYKKFEFAKLITGLGELFAITNNGNQLLQSNPDFLQLAVGIQLVKE